MPSPWTTAGLTTVAMVAFAANSLLCRAALGGGHADAATFTALRLLGGAVALGFLARIRGRPAPPSRLAWGSALSLFAYAAGFSLAYMRIPAGVGALLLFAAVQLTMIGAGLARGERPRPSLAVLERHVRRQRHAFRAHRPDVQIVDPGNAGQRDRLRRCAHGYRPRQPRSGSPRRGW